MKYKVKYSLNEQGLLSRAANWYMRKKRPVNTSVDAFTGISDYGDRLRIKTPNDIKKEIINIAKKKFANSLDALKRFENSLDSLFSLDAKKINYPRIKQTLNLIDVNKGSSERKKVYSLLKKYIELSGVDTKKTKKPKQSEFSFEPQQTDLFSYDATKDKSRTLPPTQKQIMKPVSTATAPVKTSPPVSAKIKKPKNPFTAANPPKPLPMKKRTVRSTQKTLEENTEDRKND